MSSLTIPPEIFQFITLVLGLLISAAVPTLTVAVYRLITAKTAEFKHSLSVAQLVAFENATAMVVKAANQSGAAGLIAKTGAAMKEYAVTSLQAIVDSAGWKISVEQVDAQIEAAIWQGLQLAVVQEPTIAPGTVKTTTETSVTPGGTAVVLPPKPAETPLAVPPVVVDKVGQLG